MDNGTSLNPFYLTLGTASKQSGIPKSSLSRAIKEGKLSAHRSHDSNSYRIDPSELSRYIESVAVVRNTVPKADAAQPGTGVQPAETPTEQVALIQERAGREIAEMRAALFEAQLADLRAMTHAQLAELKSMLADVRTERDRWQEQATQAMRLLPGLRPDRRGWRRWLRRAG